MADPVWIRHAMVDFSTEVKLMEHIFRRKLSHKEKEQRKLIRWAKREGFTTRYLAQVFGITYDAVIYLTTKRRKRIRRLGKNK